MVRRGMLAAVLPLCWSAVALAGDTLESVEAALIEKFAKITSMQFKMISRSDWETQGVRTKSEYEGTYELLQKDGKSYYRNEMRTEMWNNQGADGAEQKHDGNAVIVCDGEFLWMYNEGGGQKSCFKQKAGTDSGMMFNKEYFEAQKSVYNMKLLPDETVDGRAAYVIEATAKETANNPMPRMVSYHDKETGMPVKGVMMDNAGKIVGESRMTDIKVNGAIAPDRFTFKVPEGVEVMDQTKAPEGGGEVQPAAEEKEAEPAKEEQPKKEEKKTGLPKLKKPRIP